MSDAYTNTAGYYDLAPLYHNRIDKDFYLARARAANGPVLELGCGTGRILIPIAQAGVDITGFDASPEMLKVCRVSLRAAGLSTPIIEGDMRSFNLARKFSLITIPFRPFQHLYEVQDQLDCLASIRRHLTPGGRLILDVFDPNLAGVMAADGSEFLDFEFTSREGRPMERRVRRLSHDRPRQVLYMELIFRDLESGAETKAPLTMRYFFRHEMEHLLVRSGFRILEVLGDFDGSSIDQRARELVFVATPSEADSQRP